MTFWYFNILPLFSNSRFCFKIRKMTFRKNQKKLYLLLKKLEFSFFRPSSLFFLDRSLVLFSGLSSFFPLERPVFSFRTVHFFISGPTTFVDHPMLVYWTVHFDSRPSTLGPHGLDCIFSTGQSKRLKVDGPWKQTVYRLKANNWTVFAYQLGDPNYQNWTGHFF